jgi:hypothetical protein
VIAALDLDGKEATGFTQEPELVGASPTGSPAHRGGKSLVFRKDGDRLELWLDLSKAYSAHLRYRWFLKDLPYDRPFSETLEDERFDRDLLAIKVSAEGRAWQRVRTYNKQELIYRLVETTLWHAGYTTLVGMDGKASVRVRFRALDGIDGHELCIDDLELIADDTSAASPQRAN